MKQPEQSPSPEDMLKVLRTMQLRMRNYALYHFSHIDLRTIVMLQDMGIFDDQAKPKLIGANVDLAVLRDPSHARRMKLPLGPLVVYATAEEKPKRMVVELPALFYSELPEVRKAAIECLDQMIADVTPKTRDVLTKSCDGLTSESTHAWRPAAIAITDALCDDVLVALQGTRQCLECDPIIKDSLNSYAPRVIHPTISSLDSIALEVRNPESEHQKLVEIVQASVSEAKDLGDACKKYYLRLGHLPLAPPYSMSEVVSRWMATHPGTDAWTEVWDWVHVAFGPLPRYHACSVFVMNPNLVPSGKLPELWNAILEVVNDPGKKGAESINHEPWKLRCNLARHYDFHLEAHLPDNDGANIACFAWWFTERVAELFPDEPKSAQFYRKNWVKPAADMSSDIWLNANPQISRSFLRYVTFCVDSPWASGLMALMGANLDQLAPTEQSPETQTLFHDALISHLISSLPFPIETPAKPTYSLECSMSGIALKWASHQIEDQRKGLEQLVATSRTLGSAEGLCKALRGLAESPLSDQIAVAVSLKAKAYTDATVAEGIWEILSDEAWRKKVLGTVEDRVLGLLIEAFSIFQVANQNKWFFMFPHYIADLCETTENEERRRLLFLYVMHTSLASDTVSAVRRLLRGSQKAKFVEMTREYRGHVESMWAQYPPWVQARLRGLLANLHVV